MGDHVTYQASKAENKTEVDTPVNILLINKIWK